MLYNDEKMEGEGIGMKRFLVVLLVIIMSISVFCSFASEIDLGSLSAEELLDLRDSIDELLVGSDYIAVSDGLYIVGNSISAGSYDIVVLSSDFSSNGKAIGCIVITVEDSNHNDIIYDLANGVSIHVDLSDGMQMQLKQYLYKSGKAQFYIKRCSIFPSEEAENSEEP